MVSSASTRAFSRARGLWAAPPTWLVLDFWKLISQSRRSWSNERRPGFSLEKNGFTRVKKPQDCGREVGGYLKNGRLRSHAVRRPRRWHVRRDGRHGRPHGRPFGCV